MINSNGFDIISHNDNSINVDSVNQRATSLNQTKKSEFLTLFNKDISFQKNKTVEISVDQLRNTNLKKLTSKAQIIMESAQKKKKKKYTHHLIITAKNKKKKKKKKKNRANSAKDEGNNNNNENNDYHNKQKEKMKSIAGLIVIKKLSQSYFCKDDTIKNPKFNLQLSLIKEKQRKKAKKNNENDNKQNVENQKNKADIQKNVNNQPLNENKEQQRKNRFFPLRQTFQTKIDLKKRSMYPINNIKSIAKIKDKKEEQKMKKKPKSQEISKKFKNYQIFENLFSKNAPIKKSKSLKIKNHNFKLVDDKPTLVKLTSTQNIFNSELASPVNENSDIKNKSNTLLLKTIKIKPSNTNTTLSSTFRFERKSMQQIQEEKSQRIAQIRKEFNERQSQNLRDLRAHIYIILPGNASYLVKNCMQHRINWKEPFSVACSLFNFKWQQISYGLDFNNLSKFSSFKQMVNHFENHGFISNKANLFQHLFLFCEERGISIFKYVPFTIIHKIDKEESVNQEKKERLKQFIEKFGKYTKPYNEIGKYFQEKEEEQTKTEGDCYYDEFPNIILQKEENEKEKKKKEKDKPEEIIVGKKTKIEIPNTHSVGKNLWVVKAVNLNRGQCIKLVDSFEKMEKVINKIKVGVERDFTEQQIEEKKEQEESKENNQEKDKKNEKKETKEEKEERKKNMYSSNKIIIQKYIENPLLYKGRKCDMRIWVLITHKMKVYVFKEGHLKTCSVNYNIDSKDAYTHITNYSFQKHSSCFEKFEKGNEVPFYDFQSFLDEQYKDRNYSIKTDLMKQIKHIIEISMKCAKYQINCNKRKYSFEIFGYDFMLDAEFNLFLIEINTNPGLEESSPWIKVIVPRMLDDALRLTIDVLFDTKYNHELNYKEGKNSENKVEEEKNNELEKESIQINSSSIIKTEKKEDKEKVVEISKREENDKKNELEKKENNKEKEGTTNEKDIENKIEECKTNEKPQEKPVNSEKEQNTPTGNTKYISPFPVPGYTDDENLWDYICDLNEKDEFEIEQEKKNDKTYTGIKHLMKRKKLRTNGKL